VSDRAAIVIDGTAAVADDVRATYDLRTLPLHVAFGDEDYTAGVDLTPAQYYEKLARAKTMPTTSAPSLGECLETYRRLVREGFRSILVLTVIAEKSATNSVAKTAAAQIADARVEVVDTRTTSGGIALIATACGRALHDGKSFDELTAAATRLAGKVQILTFVDTLEYLRRGGRVSGAQAAFGALLSIKPIIEVRDGDAVLVDKVRTSDRGIARLKQLVEKRIGAGARIHACAMHTNHPERAREVGDWAKERFHCVEFWTADAGPVIATHTGPGLAGLCWYRSEDLA
jgi:DegV family protein with EDD domain